MSPTFPPPLPRRITLTDEPEPTGLGGDQIVVPSRGAAPYADGSTVVEVTDTQLGVIILMRQFPNGTLIPL